MRSCVLGCPNKGSKTRHLFPKNKYMRKKWLRIIHIKTGFNIVLHDKSMLCSDHFRPEDYGRESKYTGVKYHRKQLNQFTVPSQNLKFHGKDNSMLENISSTTKKVNEINKNLNSIEKCKKAPSFIASNEQQLEDSSVFTNEIEVISEERQTTEINLELEDVAKAVDASVQTNTVECIFDISRIIKDNKIHFYTGLECEEKFTLALQSLGGARFHLNYFGSQEIHMSIENQFLLTLIKLRLNRTNFELGFLFGVSPRTVSNIFITWINFMAVQWKELNLWPRSQEIEYYMPATFKSTFPTTKLIIDAMEIPIQRPIDPELHQATFSSYKNRNTLKFLVGSTPSGLISYCSDTFGGSTSDRQMVELVENLDPGDLIMADKGFNSQDMFEHKNVVVNIPNFLNGKNQFSGKKDIGNKRVNIGVIGLMKTYRILSEPLNKKYFALADRIFFVIAMLCNFKKGIVPGIQY